MSTEQSETLYEAVGQRITAFRRARGWSQGDLAAKLGLTSRQRLQNWERGKALPRPAQLAALCSALGVSLSDVMEGTGSMSVDMAKPKDTHAGHGALDDAVESSDYVGVRRVRLKLSAGVTGFAIESDIKDESPIFFHEKWFVSRRLDASKLLGLKVSGASMEPGLYDGDTVVINTSDTVCADGEVFAVNYEGELVIKRMKRDGGEWWLASDNSDKRRYPDKRAGDGVILLGRVVYKSSERI